METLLKTIHVLAAIAWGGGGLIRQVLFARVRASGDESRLTGFLEEDTFLGRAYYNVFGILTLVAGVWLVLITNWEFSQAWISIGFAGIIVGVVFGAALYPRQIRPALEALQGGTAATAEAVAGPLGRLVTLTRIELIVLVVVVWAMVAKPGA